MAANTIDSTNKNLKEDVVLIAKKQAIRYFFIVSASIATIAGVISVLRRWPLEWYEIFIALPLPMSMIAGYFLLKNNELKSYPIILAILYCYLVIFINSAMTGGLFSSSIYFCIAWSVAVTFCYGWRGAISALIAITIQFVTMLVFMESLPVSDLLASPKKLAIVMAVSMFIVAVLICVCSAIYDYHVSKSSKQLADAWELAESADRAKSDFLANMSHEIRTPMNGVMGMAELLERTELDSKQKMFTDVIVKSGSSLLTIINDILDFSKLEAGQMTLDSASFNLREAIEDVAVLVSSKVAEKDLELIVRIDPNMPEYMIGDVGRLRQVITNIVGNSVKFTEAGHVYINATTKELSSGSMGIRFEIEDTGIGIPKEQVTTVFEKFSQADSSSQRKHEGTGLGLSICSHIIALMNGTIGVESELGQGSLFWFEIALPGDHETSSKIKPPVDIAGARILVVDDNEINRSILLEQMSKWGFDAAAVNNGQEALAFLETVSQSKIKIDCMVLDYQMPEMNGAQVAKRIREISHIPDLPILMLTSVDSLDDGNTFSSLNIDAHLTKPARSSILLETIYSIIQDKRSSEFATLEKNATSTEVARTKKMVEYS